MQRQRMSKKILKSHNRFTPFVSSLFGLNSVSKISETTEYFNKMQNNSNFENSKHD